MWDRLWSEIFKNGRRDRLRWKGEQTTHTGTAGYVGQTADGNFQKWKEEQTDSVGNMGQTVDRNFRKWKGEQTEKV